MMKFKLRLRTILVLTLFVSVLLAWVAWERSTNADRLEQVIDRMGERKIEASDFHSSETRPQWLNYFLGNAAPVPQRLRCFGFSEDDCSDLASNRAIRSVKELHLVTYLPGNKFFNGTWDIGDGPYPFDQHGRESGVRLIPANSKPIFVGWPNLERIVIRDTPLPIMWLEAIENLPALKEVVVSGGNCNLEPELLVACPSLESIVLCHRGIDARRLHKLREMMPEVEIQLLGSFESHYSYASPEQTLSFSDEARTSSMRNVLNAISKKVKEKGATNHTLLPPAKRFEIAALEQELGYPLPDELRAFYDVTQSWEDGPLMYGEGLRSPEKVLGDFRGRTGLAYRPDDYDFNATGFDQFANPNGIPLSASRGMMANTGEMCSLDPGGEGGPWDLQDFGLLGYLEMIEGVIAAGRIDIDRKTGQLIADGGY